VTDPKAGAYCQIRLDSGEKILVNHDRGSLTAGRLTIEEVKWLGLMPGETLFTVDLESAEGQGIMARLTKGAAEGTARSTPLGAFVEYVKDCPSVADVRKRCAEIPTMASA
jgi:hypothetical protein